MAAWDAVTSVYLFHELPPRIRRAVFAEFSRVLKPGGRLIIVDSLQSATCQSTTGCWNCFRRISTNRIFFTYLAEDFSAIVRDHGLLHRSDTTAFVSKVMVFDKLA